ncbi:MAG: Gfo/Idh/MocA family oxidoreductase [Fimbriimonadia bacterium]|nr:Gfo/Idh/MocA family oxidoreductase [Fimbriimonadia bacterium]
MSIRCAVVGFGAAFNMGQSHCETIEAVPGLELVAVYDADPSRREAAREKFGVKTPDNYEELLADPQVDLVTTVTPHDTHAPLIIQALNAGKHAITEKVMCLNAAEADAMIAAAKQNNRLLSVFHNRRWDSDYLTVKKAVQSGALGALFMIESTVNGYGKPGGWRGVKKHGGGMLYDWGAHLIDQIVQMLLPSKPIRIYADIQERVWTELDIETQAQVHIKFDNGCAAVVDVGCISLQNRPRWLVRGEKGAVKGEWDKLFLKTPDQDPVELEKVAGDWKDYYRNISAVLNEGAELLVKPEEVRIVMQVIDAAFESARTGESVKL